MESRSPMPGLQVQQNIIGLDRCDAAVKRQYMGAWKDDNASVTSASLMSTTTAGTKMVSRNINNSTGRDSFDDNADIDGSNGTHVELLIKDLEGKAQQQLELFRADCFTRTKEVEQLYVAEMVKLPKSIRQMSVREFNAKHKCNVLQLLKRHDGCVVSSAQEIPSAHNSMMMTMVKKRDRLATYSMQTPAPTTNRLRQGIGTGTGTVLRTVRRGEILYSQNGSPVEHGERSMHDEGSVVLTVTKKRRGNGHAAGRTGSSHNRSGDGTSESSPCEIEINVGDGTVISLNDPHGVHELDSSVKATAASQLKIIQDQMASLMAQLEKK